jgi:phosphoglycerate dehydrogenase-like enzyme
MPKTPYQNFPPHSGDGGLGPVADDLLSVTLSEPDDLLAEAIVQSGGRLVPPGPETTALVWNRQHKPDELEATLPAMPALKWVQLPSAGVDDFAGAGIITPDLLWTSAKGAYAAPVAEHALALILAMLRQIPERVRAESWGRQAGKTLYGARVVILGAGGIAQEFIRLTVPFGTKITVVRRTADPIEAAHRTIRTNQLAEVLPEADVLLLATPLTAETAGIIGAPELAALPKDAVLINVARGGLVRTQDLIAALAQGQIAGAALDVTDPEPLPTNHPLWKEPRALITPHTADTADMIRPLLARRVADNIRRYRAGKQLIGIVDPAAGY